MHIASLVLSDIRGPALALTHSRENLLLDGTVLFDILGGSLFFAFILVGFCRTLLSIITGLVTGT